VITLRQRRQVPSNDTWVAAPPLPADRGYLVGASGRDGRIYAVDGLPQKCYMIVFGIRDLN
jgi:hypothetical protein